MKAAPISGCLKDITWKNKYLSLESKVKIYKTAVRPILTYAAETRADTSKTKQLLRTTEMNTLRTITGRTRRDRVRNSSIREECKINDIIKFARRRREEWNNHVTRAGSHNLIKIVRDSKPAGTRCPGRPLKRWRESWITTSNDSNWWTREEKQVIDLHKRRRRSVSNKAIVTWVPGHTGIKGNDKVESLAKNAAYSKLLGPELTFGVPHSQVCRAVTDWTKKQLTWK